VVENYEAKRELVYATVEDLVADFLYYDRKQDEELSSDDIYTLLDEGFLTIEDLVAKFHRELESALKD